jgi:hypothetical protein
VLGLGPRQAWCPRCDEVRRARPRSPCPKCSARLVALPRQAGPAFWLAERTALLQRARSWIPALRAVAAAALLLGLVAAAFVAGRGSSPSSAAPAGAASTTPPTVTTPGGRVIVPGGQRDFGWRAEHGRISVLLRTMFSAGETTSVTLEVRGLEPGWSAEGVGDLRVLDARGRELALARFVQDARSFRTGEPAGGASLVTGSLPGRVDAAAVAQVSVGRLFLLRQSEEHLSGTLADADLKRRVDQRQSGGGAVPPGPASCRSCRLQVRCESCSTVRMAGAAYRHGQVALLLTPTERSPGEPFPDAEILVSGDSGQIASLDTGLDSGATVVSFDARDLAETTERGQTRMSFSVMAMLTRMQVTAGPWRLDQRSGSR